MVHANHVKGTLIIKRIWNGFGYVGVVYSMEEVFPQRAIATGNTCQEID